jgi:hypothetical protein
MGSTFGLAFSISQFIFFYFDLSRHLQQQRAVLRMNNLWQFHQGFATSSCMYIYRLMVRTIVLMVKWPSLLRYVNTYNKDKQSRWKLMGNLGKFVDVNRYINLYIGNLYGVWWWILVYMNMCLMMYLINFCLCIWWLQLDKSIFVNVYMYLWMYKPNSVQQ